jgi:hypothetical protein
MICNKGWTLLLSWEQWRHCNECVFNGTRRLNFGLWQELEVSSRSLPDGWVNWSWIAGAGRCSALPVLGTMLVLSTSVWAYVLHLGVCVCSFEFLSVLESLYGSFPLLLIQWYTALLRVRGKKGKLHDQVNNDFLELFFLLFFSDFGIVYSSSIRSSSVAASWKGLRNIFGGTCSDELVFEVRL